MAVGISQRAMAACLRRKRTISANAFTDKLVGQSIEMADQIRPYDEMKTHLDAREKQIVIGRFYQVVTWMFNHQVQSQILFIR